MKTGNPALTRAVFTVDDAVDRAGAAFLRGVMVRLSILLGCVLFGAGCVWIGMRDHRLPSLELFVLGTLGGTILGVATVLRRRWASITAPAFSFLEGLCLGSISAQFELQYPGVAVKAVAVTFGIVAFLLLLYRSRLLRVGDIFRRTVIAATGGIALISVSVLAMHSLGFCEQCQLQSSALSWLVQIIVAMVAAFNVVLDFDFIDQQSKRGASRQMEWYGAFALVVTLSWLYLEILNILLKGRERQDGAPGAV
jgi:uncharacterized YccA/Bax inhibitor family protein